jgi:RNA polymerase sigma factor (sigma-70 family)
LLEDVMTDDPDPDTTKRIERAVRKLSRLLREIFLAARLDEMSYVEIAERTGLSVGQVEREIARALVSIVRRMARRQRRWWRFR